MLRSIVEIGTSFVLKLNLTKSELFWPSGDEDFLSYSNRNQASKRWSGPIRLSKIWLQWILQLCHCETCVDFVLCNQSLLLDRHDLQMQLLYLRSRLGSCKVNNLLRTVPPDKAELQWNQFDAALRDALL